MRKLLIASIVLLATAAFVPGLYARGIQNAQQTVQQLEIRLAQTKADMRRAEAQLTLIQAEHGPDSPNMVAARADLEILHMKAQSELLELESFRREIKIAEKVRLAAGQSAREQATQRADELAQHIQELASSDDAAVKLQAELTQATLDQLRARYAALAEQAYRTEKMVEAGYENAGSADHAKLLAEEAFSAYRETMLRAMLEEIQRERDAGRELSLRMPGGDNLVMPTNRSNAPTTLPTVTLKVDVPYQSKYKLEPLTNQQPLYVDRQVLQAEFFRGYLDTVQRYGELAADPAAARVAAVITAADMLSDEPEKAIDFLRDVIVQIESSQPSDQSGRTVLRVARLQLADFYRQAGKDIEALSELRRLAIGADPR